jgi:hypothetical protein
LSGLLYLRADLEWGIPREQCSRTMAWQIVESSSWTSLAEQLQHFSGRGGVPRMLCRGQSKAGRLIASVGRIFRDLKASKAECWKIERRAADEFRRRFTSRRLRHHGPRPLPIELQLWPIMQHYGAPTRLLDWTWSPYVAAYHAVRERFNHDGLICAFDPRALIVDAEEGAESDPARVATLNGHVDAGRYDQLFGAAELEQEFVYVFEPPNPFPRQIMQQGTFTVATDPRADHGPLIDRASLRAGTEPPCLIRIPAEAKREILHELHAMNLGPHTLFPGNDGLGRHVRETLELMVLEEKSELADGPSESC